MTFTNEEILQCFEPVVARILELVRNQIIAIEAQHRLLQVRSNGGRVGRRSADTVETERARRRRFRCIGISVHPDHSSRPASISKEGGPPYGFGCRHRQGSRDCRHHRTSRHLPCRPKTLSYGDIAAFQRGPPPRTVPCTLSGWKRPLQVYPADLRAAWPACQDWGAGQGLLLPASCPWRHAHVRGYPLRMRRGCLSRVHQRPA